jgi:hypothetical protein
MGTARSGRSVDMAAGRLTSGAGSRDLLAQRAVFGLDALDGMHMLRAI